ncbi:MAG: NifU family protein [Flavobacteriaceae bacterium]
MITVKTIPTSNPAILKFEFSEFVSKENYEFKNIDEAKLSPLAQKMFYLPFVKTVYISGNFMAIERYNIVEWDDMKDEVAQQITEFVNNGGQIVIQTEQPKKNPVSVYAESTPNPAVMKFVCNKLLVKNTVEFKNIEEAASSELAQALFRFPFVKEVFLDENYISVTKYNISEWDEVVQELRSFIKEFIEQGKSLIDETKYVPTPQQEKQLDQNFEKLDATSQQIINILEEYVKPAVASDGGNILFDSYDETEKRVKVILQGACSGCPSSTFTLKSGIENMLKDMLKDGEIKVEAVNQ